MTFIGRLCSPFCRKPKRGDEANLSESTVDESSPHSAWSLPARLLKKHDSILSHAAPMPTHIAESIPIPTSAPKITPKDRKQKRKWRLSNREALLDGNGGLVYVKEFVLQSPVSPASRTHDLPIYDAHMRSPTVFEEQYHEVCDDDLKDVEVKQMENHINPGHEALDLLARMSANEPGGQSRSERGKERRVSLCAPGSKRERTEGYSRPTSLPLYAGFGSIDGNATYNHNVINATAYAAPRRISEHNETTSDTSSIHAHLELDSTHMPPTSPSSPSTPLTQTSQPHTSDEPRTPITPSTTSHPSPFTSSHASSSNDSPSSPLTPNPSSHSSPSNSWTLPPVFERLCEDAERRQKQHQQEEHYSRC